MSDIRYWQVEVEIVTDNGTHERRAAQIPAETAEEAFVSIKPELVTPDERMVAFKVFVLPPGAVKPDADDDDAV